MNTRIKELTDKKLAELSNLSLEISNTDGSLMDVVRQNIKVWDKKLFPLCKLCNVNFVDTVAEILGNGGYSFEKNKLTTYMSRARKGE